MEPTKAARRNWRRYPLIYLDACALLKFIKSEPETGALRTWRQALPEGTELATSELAQLEITN